MASNWCVSLNNGAKQQIAELGWSNLRVEVISQAVSTCTFLIKMDEVTDAPSVTEGQTFVLYNDTTIHFVGTVTRVAATGRAKEIFWHVTVSNAWYFLERIVYQQPVVVQVKSGTSWVNTVQMSSRVTLGQDTWGRPLPILNQIYNILSYASIFGVGGIAIGNLVLGGLKMPLQECKDITCAEALRRCLSWSPNAVVGFNYGTGASNFNATDRTDLTAGSLDLLDPTKYIEVEDINPRYDMHVPGVSITFVTYKQDTPSPTGDGNWHTIYTTQTAGSPWAEGGIFGTIELGNPGQLTAEAPPTGIASAYFAALQGSKWQGRVTITERECSAPVILGQYLNIVNGPSSWASMAAVVQQIVEEIDHGKTTITFGPPQHLGPQDFTAMMMLLRNIAPPGGTAGVTHNGTTGAGSPTVPAPPVGPAMPGITSVGPASDPGNQPPWTPPGTGGGAAVSNPGVGKIPPSGKGGGLFTAPGGTGMGGALSTGIVSLTLCDTTTVSVLTASAPS